MYLNLDATILISPQQPLNASASALNKYYIVELHL